MTDENELTREAMAITDDLLELLDARTEHRAARDAIAVQQTAAATLFVETVESSLRLQGRPVTLAGAIEAIHAAPWTPLVRAALDDPYEPAALADTALRTVCVHRTADDGAAGGLVKIQTFGPFAPPGMQLLMCIDCLGRALASLKDLMISRGGGPVPPPSARH